MIIEALFNMIFKLFTSFLEPINIPDLPEDMKEQITSFVDTLITSAAPMIDLVMPYNVVKVLVPIVITIELAVEVYKLVMWIITKIPMANIQR